MSRLKTSLPLITVTLLSSGCMQGGLLFKSSDCPEGQTRTGGSMCVPVTAESAKLSATACKDPDLAALKAGVEVTMCDGSVGIGTLGLCNEDGQSSCINEGDFKAVKASNLDADKIALGTTIAGVTGTKREMKQCRNAAYLPLWDTGSLAEAEANTNSQLGNLDPWDTIDDYTNNLGPAGSKNQPNASPWGPVYICDNSNFTNISTLGLAGLTPTGGPVGGDRNFTQIWRDDLSGLYFTNALAIGGSSTVNWQGAMSLCSGLNSGDGAGNWRLPTQKELMQLYVNGASRLDGGSLAEFVWSSSGVSSDTNSAWMVSLNNGFAGWGPRYDLDIGGALCVR